MRTDATCPNDLFRFYDSAKDGLDQAAVWEIGGETFDAGSV